LAGLLGGIAFVICFFFAHLLLLLLCCCGMGWDLLMGDVSHFMSEMGSVKISLSGNRSSESGFYGDKT
jgi:hypothetical protein